MNHFKDAADMKAWNARYAGKKCGSTNQYGYLCVSLKFNKKMRVVLVHRIVWAMHFGKWPSEWLDHINGVRTDNRISNLREVSPLQNAWNSIRKRGKSPTGVTRTSNNKYSAKIKVNGKDVHLGTFNSESSAAYAYENASKKYHGECSSTYRCTK